MVVQNVIFQENSDVILLRTQTGTEFYFRLAFLSLVKPEELSDGREFLEEKEEELIEAGLSFACERKAEELLARQEHCRSGLEKKLLLRKFSKKSVQTALDYLESRKLLDDRRFAFAWVRSHLISKPQGKIRLMAELQARGVSRLDAKAAVDEYFETTDELEVCRRAMEKALKAGKTGDKLNKYLQDSGFTYSLIKQCSSSF